MRGPMKSVLFLILSLSFLTACNKSENSSARTPNSGDDVQWTAIPQQFNPEVITDEFDLDRVREIQMNLFGYDDNVRLQYSPDLPRNRAHLAIYKVSQKARTSVRVPRADYREGTLQLRSQGSYECSIQIRNGQIQDLLGACIVKVVLTLPSGSLVEVENAGRQLSDRRSGMSNEKFLRALKRAFPSERFAVIQEYVRSYAGTGYQPSLATRELREVLKEFSFDDDKLEVLRKLHGYVYDREKLDRLIEESFSSYFSREKAREIVGR